MGAGTLFDRCEEIIGDGGADQVAVTPFMWLGVGGWMIAGGLAIEGWCGNDVGG